MNTSSRAVLGIVGSCVLLFSAICLAGVTAIFSNTQEEYNNTETTLPPGMVYNTGFYSEAPIFEVYTEFSDLMPVPCNFSVLCSETNIDVNTILAAGNSSRLSKLGYAFDMKVLRVNETLNVVGKAYFAVSTNNLYISIYSGNYSSGTPNVANTNMSLSIWANSRMTIGQWWFEWGFSAIGFVLGGCAGLIVIFFAALKRFNK